MMFGFVTQFFLRALLPAVAVTVSITAEEVGCFDPVTSPFNKNDWLYCQKISSDDHEVFMYYTPLEDTVLLGFHALKNTEGWTALGINGNGGMKGATFITVREDGGDWIAEDRHAMDYVMPALDDQQDVRLLFAKQENGQTAWGVVIPQNSCDSDGNDYEILDRMTTMLWAVGSSHTFATHTARGQFQANLMQAPKELPSTDELPYFEILMPNVTIKMGEGGTDPTNPYICSYYDLAEIGQSSGFAPEETLHVTRLSAVLSPETKEHVHHMILYACSTDGFSYNGTKHLTVIPECVSMPADCREMKWPWAVGGRDSIFPEKVGLPIGGAMNRFLVLQVHYYNPTLKEGMKDNSGVRVYYTTELLEQEAGVMEFVGGVNSFQQPPLPAGEKSVSISFTTPSECTRNVWDRPLNILGVLHHMHTYGTYMEISVVRDGVNLGNLRPESHYDFRHQSMDEPVPAIRQLWPGDQVTQTCVYDTTNAPGSFVEFGDTTQQEMCYTPIYYYPRQTDADSFGSLIPWLNSSWCLEPATSEEFQSSNSSLCAQTMYENVPLFYRFDKEGELTFDLLTACSGGNEFQDLFYEFPDLCPTCRVTANCTHDDVALHAQNLCATLCNEVNGLSLYPDMNRTKPYQYGNWGCSPTYYHEPYVPDAPVCQARGNANIDFIQLNGIALLDIPNDTLVEANSESTACRKAVIVATCILSVGATLFLSVM
ncbi:hypothetical protein HJC23_012108 [Cyclotella cryptica]|uniref:DOMON domain-containing protein n=1 Tax=Cyclotella cryptica TaxID=29204 RepID=A0ABD3P5E5_9STRA|eukprot:CCRYP_017443-RA/>CCRYP_017443-RA protein AED:0.11 eAED:0.11 QI:2071/1/1/1/0.33/0.25/4/434/711